MLRKSDIATPEDIGYLMDAFEAGQQKERERILSAIRDLEKNELATEELGVLRWTKKLVKELGLEQ